MENLESACSLLLTRPKGPDGGDDAGSITFYFKKKANKVFMA